MWREFIVLDEIWISSKNSEKSLLNITQLLPLILDCFQLESHLAKYDYAFKITLQAFLWPTVVIGVVGNLAVLIRIFAGYTSKLSNNSNVPLKTFYLFSLVSFAVSDLLFLVSSGTNALATISRDKVGLWNLPSWTCSVLPYLQTVAVISGSITLTGIAVDRYKALEINPAWSRGLSWPCVTLYNLFLWLLAFGVSYPILGMYTIRTFKYRGEHGCVEGFQCGLESDINVHYNAALVYSIIFAVIFMPLIIVFITVHVLLASNILRFRLHSSEMHQSSGNNSQPAAAENSTGPSEATNNPLRLPPNEPLNMTKRKRRIIKIISVLIIVYIVGKLPSWILLMCKLRISLKGMFWVYVQQIFSSLMLLNAALNPFLYAFLSETLSVIDVLKKVRCCKKNDPVYSIPNC
ncbi:hypothetical protein TKK_0012561 [Trichogramma kaykai]|uniref:G-protein coupled receptors family 1 profile domain-containing protein n=1 Tax=Trichogramma kaykai TaxID=54128 RepID=A0ABD2WMS4_9HYME